MKRFLNLFCKIKYFDIVTLHTSGMCRVTDYEIVMNGDEAEVSQYAVGYRDGEKVRQLEKTCRMLCGICAEADEQMPSAVVGRIIKDGTNFILKATVNEGKEIYATGSQRFPRHYGDFRDRLREMLNNK